MVVGMMIGMRMVMGCDGSEDGDGDDGDGDSDGGVRIGLDNKLLRTKERPKVLVKVLLFQAGLTVRG